MQAPVIAVFPGDGIGPEVMNSACAALKAPPPTLRCNLSNFGGTTGTQRFSDEVLARLSA